ncbi:MAG: Do family serine endopeptidase [Verrucomicrobiota bacterium]
MKAVFAAISLLLSSVLILSADTRAAPLQFDLNLDPIYPEDGQPVVSYADILERATPSVVGVYTARFIKISNTRNRQNIPEIFRQFGLPVPEIQEEPQSEGRERKQEVGAGSGVILSKNGYVVTNHHVVVDERGGMVDEIRVRLGDGSEYVAELIGSDQKTDVAVLKIEGEEDFPAITVADSSNLRVGDVVFAIGNPLSVGLTATQGIVSATGRNSLGILGNGSYEDFIQTDASINLGNSGGALIDAWGRLIGINTAIVSGTGGSIGIGFAIPMNLVRNVMTNLIESGEVPRGLLGLFPENLSQELAEAFGLDSTQGALVNQVQPDSPAELGGIRHGDVIIQIDDIEIVSAPQLRLTVSQMMPGTEVDVKLIRKGKTKTVPVTLGSVSGRVASSTLQQDILEGIMLERLSDSVRDELEVPDDIEGVLVSEVADDSPYFDKFTRPLIIIEVNGEVTKTPQDVKESLVTGSNRLYVWTQGRARFMAINIEE